MATVTSRLAWLLAGLVFGVIGGAVAQPTTLQLNTSALNRLADVQAAASNVAATMTVTNTGVLLARCIGTRLEAEALGLNLYALPVCHETAIEPFRIPEGVRLSHMLDGGDWVWERCTPKKMPPAPPGATWLKTEDCTEVARWPHGECSDGLARFSPWGERHCGAWKDQ